MNEEECHTEVLPNQLQVGKVKSMYEVSHWCRVVIGEGHERKRHPTSVHMSGAHSNSKRPEKQSLVRAFTVLACVCVCVHACVTVDAYASTA